MCADFKSILLNRTLIYASLRRPIRLPLKTRVLLRIVPIGLLLCQVYHMMLAMRCQTSVLFQGERKDGAAVEGGSDFFFHAIGTASSFWLDDKAVCQSIGMIPDKEWIDLASTVQNTENPEVLIPAPKGSMDILWPLYKTLSISQFVEVFTCSLTGRVPSETGMTLLEHSLAYAEAEALATRKTYRLETTSSPNDGEEAVEGKPRVFKMKGELLVPSEVLYISIISSLSHITSHVMGIFNRQTEYRLLTTGFYCMAFLGGFAAALIFGGTAGILEFPTMSVVGFIPYILSFACIFVCASVYTLALILSSLFPPSGNRGVREGFNNLRANLTLSSTTISLRDDFFAVLLRLGGMCITAAAEATYLNEGRAVQLPGWTWLESERARMLDSTLGRTPASQFSTTGKGAGPFAQERRDFRGVVESKKDKRARTAGGRWVGAGEMIRGVVVVLGRWGIVGVSRILGLRVVAPPPPSVPSPVEDEDESFYRRFLSDCTLPETDESGEYLPDSDSDSDSDSEPDDNDDDDQRTPTRRDATPPLLDPHRLASLLDPQTPEDRASARLLARHLTSPTALTRHKYSSERVSGAAEESALENILLTRRQRRRQESYDEHVEGSGGGPVCVVCQCEPRTVIVWPCRCLSLCEDCRVCLAMNNWSNCVTCRVPCIGYSKVFVP